MNRLFRIALLLYFCAATDRAAAQIPASEYAARRDSLARHVGDGVVIAFGAPEPVTDDGSFRQYPAFLYLTGFQDPDAALLMVVRGGRPASAMLYVPTKDPRMALYTGFVPDSTSLLRKLGIGITALASFRPAVDSLTAQGLALWQVPDVSSRDYLRQDSLSRGRHFISVLRAERPSLDVKDAQSILDSLRVRKSPAEIALIRKAARITMQGHAAAVRAIAPGKSEGIVQATAEYAFRTNGADGPSYGAIVGSGPNSTSYHYRANNRTMNAGEVVVMDMGALYDSYAADVTRTAPVSGKFTPDQRRIYQIVRDAQAAAEKLARPGARVADGDSAVRHVEAEALAKLGLIQSPDAMFDPPWTKDCTKRPLSCRQVFLYMAHGLGHGIGPEVHDAGGYSYSPTGRFQEGEVFTIEPGVYISTKLLDMLPDTPRNREFIAHVRPAVERYNNIGIRIEDNFIVTSTGVEWITPGLREADEIEALMRGRK